MIFTNESHTKTKKLSAGFDIVVNNDTKALFPKHAAKTSKFITKPIVKNADEVDCIPNPKRCGKSVNMVPEAIARGDRKVFATVLDVNSETKLITKKYNKAFIGKNLFKKFELKKDEKVTELNKKTKKVEKKTTFADYDVKHKVIFILAIIAISLLGLSAMFLTATYANRYGRYIPSKAWPIVTGVFYLLGIIATFTIFGLFTVLTVKSTIACVKGKQIKSGLPINVINMVMLLLIFIFGIIGLTRAFALFTFNKSQSIDDLALFKFEAGIGIIVGIVIYIMQYSKMFMNEEYAAADAVPQLKRILFLTVGVLAIYAFGFTLFWIGFATSSRYYYIGVYYNKIASIFALKFIIGLVGVIALLLVTLEGFVIYSHFLIRKNKNFIRDTIIYGIIALLMLVLFIVFAVKGSSTYMKKHANFDPTSTSFIAFHFILEFISLAIGIVGIIFSKKIIEDYDGSVVVNQPKKPEAKEEKKAEVKEEVKVAAAA